MPSSHRTMRQSRLPALPARIPRRPSSTARFRTHQRSRGSASIRRVVPVRGNRRTPLQRHLALTPLGRSGPGPGGRLPSHTVGLFRCSREPIVSLPRRSRARRPTLPDRLRDQRSTRFARSAPLVIGRLIAGTHDPTHVPAVNETANNQGPQADGRFGLSDTSSGITRPTGRERVYIYTTRGSGKAAAGCVCQ